MTSLRSWTSHRLPAGSFLARLWFGGTGLRSVIGWLCWNNDHTVALQRVEQVEAFTTPRLRSTLLFTVAHPAPIQVLFCICWISNIVRSDCISCYWDEWFFITHLHRSIALHLTIGLWLGCSSCHHCSGKSRCPGQILKPILYSLPQRKCRTKWFFRPFIYVAYRFKNLGQNTCVSIIYISSTSHPAPFQQIYFTRNYFVCGRVKSRHRSGRRVQVLRWWRQTSDRCR